jgi:hypothetical protein
MTTTTEKPTGLQALMLAIDPLIAAILILALA